MFICTCYHLPIRDARDVVDFFEDSRNGRKKRKRTQKEGRKMRGRKMETKRNAIRSVFLPSILLPSIFLRIFFCVLLRFLRPLPFLNIKPAADGVDEVDLGGGADRLIEAALDDESI